MGLAFRTDWHEVISCSKASTHSRNVHTAAMRVKTGKTTWPDTKCSQRALVSAVGLNEAHRRWIPGMPEAARTPSLGGWDPGYREEFK